MLSTGWFAASGIRVRLSPRPPYTSTTESTAFCRSTVPSGVSASTPPTMMVPRPVASAEISSGPADSAGARGRRGDDGRCVRCRGGDPGPTGRVHWSGCGSRSDRHDRSSPSRTAAPSRVPRTVPGRAPLPGPRVGRSVFLLVGTAHSPRRTRPDRRRTPSSGTYQPVSASVRSSSRCAAASGERRRNGRVLLRHRAGDHPGDRAGRPAGPVHRDRADHRRRRRPAGAHRELPADEPLGRGGAGLGRAPQPVVAPNG
jgi:hypothetical protein